MHDNLPTFLIIGAAKSGTTSIFQWLCEHPEVFVPATKEINYFAWSDDEAERKVHDRYTITKFHAKTLDEYKALFSGMSNEKAAGEGSPMYMTSPVAHENIRRHIPDAKLIVALRNPADRAISSYFMNIGLGKEKRSIDEVFSRPEQEYYVYAGEYRRLLEHYYELFPREQIRVVLFDELTADPLSVMHELCQYVGVDTDFRPRVEQVHKKGGLPANLASKKTLAIINSVSRSPLARMIKRNLPCSFRARARTRIEGSLMIQSKADRYIRQRLVEYYAPGIDALGQLIERDLSCWTDDK